ncbi:MAG: type II toxin-antitoxin system VapC family toxin [Blastocatellia bacterium]
MSQIILLDTGPLGLVSNPQWSSDSEECNEWLEDRLSEKISVFVPEISDYELRRELIRAGKIKGIAKLNSLKRSLGYVRITTWTMLKAAEFWAQSRRLGKPTSSDASLDADVILAAQGAFLENKGHNVIIATNNVKHLDMFVDARVWSDIT